METIVFFFLIASAAIIGFFVGWRMAKDDTFDRS